MLLPPKPAVIYGFKLFPVEHLLVPWFFSLISFSNVCLNILLYLHLYLILFISYWIFIICFWNIPMTSWSSVFPGYMTSKGSFFSPPLFRSILGRWSSCRSSRNLSTSSDWEWRISTMPTWWPGTWVRTGQFARLGHPMPRASGPPEVVEHEWY